MISISSSLGFTLYVGIFLVALLTLWYVDNKRRAKKVSLPPLFQLYICEYCQYPYLDESYKAVTRCPQCETFNKNNHYHRE